MRKIFLDDLPHKYGFGANKDKLTIDWISSVGMNVRFEYDNIVGVIEITAYSPKSQKISFLYNGIEYERSKSTIANCNLQDIIGIRNVKHKYKVGDIINNRTIIGQIRIKQTNNKKGYMVKCNIDGYESKVDECNLINGQGCPVCSGQVVMRGVNSVYDTHKWVADYVVDCDLLYKISKGHKNKILMRCPDCRQEKMYSLTDLIRYKRISCTCADKISYPNKIMFNLLKQLNVQFISEYSPQWIGRKRYDFYIPSKNLIVEMDGALGHGCKAFNESQVANKESIEIDKFKDKQALLHNLKVVRIDCNYKTCDRFLYIKNNIENSGVFSFENLKHIDWVELDKTSTQNTIKQVCKDWDGGKYKYLKDLATKYNMDQNTIRGYLKKGSEFGWCSYNKDKILENGRKSLSQKVGVFIDGVLVKEFGTKRSLKSQSKKIFGMHFNSSKIKLCCSGEIANINGYEIRNMN